MWVLDLDELTAEEVDGRSLIGPRIDLARYAALFAERKPDGAPLTLTEIGGRMNVSREWVRQVRKRYFQELPSIRIETKAHTKERKTTARFASLPLFRLTVRGWLLDEGYFQCTTCRAVKCIATDRTGKCKGRISGRCKTCAAANVRRRNATPAGRAKLLAWRAAHPEKVREYARRFSRKTSKTSLLPCPACGQSVAATYGNRAVPAAHKLPDGQWCTRRG